MTDGDPVVPNFRMIDLGAVPGGIYAFKTAVQVFIHQYTPLDLLSRVGEEPDVRNQTEEGTYNTHLNFSIIHFYLKGVF